MNKELIFLTILPALATSPQRFWVAPFLSGFLFSAGFNFYYE